jgi:BirA family biotin operon repressor/biotin-[acetyl-CoA-carboxylase] ligase
MKEVKQNKLKEEEILKFLKKNCDLEWNLSLYEELESTNDYLIEVSNPNEYCLCVAESQTKGRGRNLKSWQSPKYENIYMSLSFSTKGELKNFSSFSLVTALAVHNVLLRQNIFTEIKWPNDIYLNKKKIGGILIETFAIDRENLIVVGIGLNVFMEKNTEIERDWTSLKLEFENIEMDRNEIISEIANEVLILKSNFENKGFDAFVKDFNKLNFLKDKKVFLSNSVKKEGTALDINSDGSLNVRIGNQTEKISSGEVSININ